MKYTIVGVCALLIVGTILWPLIRNSRRKRITYMTGDLATGKKTASVGSSKQPRPAQVAVAEQRVEVSVSEPEIEPVVVMAPNLAHTAMADDSHLSAPVHTEQPAVAAQGSGDFWSGASDESHVAAAAALASSSRSAHPAGSGLAKSPEREDRADIVPLVAAASLADATGAAQVVEGAEAPQEIYVSTSASSESHVEEKAPARSLAYASAGSGSSGFADYGADMGTGPNLITGSSSLADHLMGGDAGGSKVSTIIPPVEIPPRVEPPRRSDPPRDDEIPVASSVAPAVVDPPVERVTKDLSTAELTTFKVAWPTPAAAPSATAPAPASVTTDAVVSDAPSAATMSPAPAEDGEVEGPSEWLINTRIAEALRSAEESGTVEKYLDDRGDVIRLHLRLDEDEFRRLTSSSNAGHFQEWSGPVEP